VGRDGNSISFCIVSFSYKRSHVILLAYLLLGLGQFRCVYGVLVVCLVEGHHVPYSKASLSTCLRGPENFLSSLFYVLFHLSLSHEMSRVLADPNGIVKPLVEHYEGLKVSPGHSDVRVFTVSTAHDFSER